MAQPFDPGQLKLSGQALPVGEQFGSMFGSASFSISETGGLAYYSSAGPVRSRLAWVDRSGAQTVAAPEGQYYDPELSPNGRYVAFERGFPRDLWIRDLQRGVSSQFTIDPADDLFPVWSPNGQTVLFMSTRKSNAGNLYRRTFGIAGPDEPFLTDIVARSIASWSADDRYIVYSQDGDYWAMPLREVSKPIRLTQTPFIKGNGRVSPDSHWFAYEERGSSGRSELYIQSFPQPAAKEQVSSDGGTAPRWRSDSRELFFIAPDSAVMSVSINPVGSPRSLFQARIVGGGTTIGDLRAQYDVASDGRLLMNIEAEPAPITVILNWVSGLKQ
jgi:serine/threonine-protein kinase